jgi:hypothetical protein
MVATYTVRADVERSIEELGLAHLVRLPSAEAEGLFKEIDARFVEGARRRWIWESFRLPHASRRFEDDKAFARLPLLVPSVAERLLFFPRSDADATCAYEGTIDTIVAVIGDCAAFEYCIVPPGLEWLLCENHHGVLMAIGEPVQSRLRAAPPTGTPWST